MGDAAEEHATPARRMTPSQLLDIEPRRICVIKPSALGDVVQTLPLLPVLRERFPDASVSWVIAEQLADLLRGHPHLNRIIEFRRKNSWSAWKRLLSELRSARFDLVFDLQGLFRTGLMTLATGAPVRVGLETAREGSALACNCVLPDTGRQVPAHLRYWRVAELLGKGDVLRESFAVTDEGNRLWAEQTLDGVRGPLLAIHPGARWITKRWPVESFAVIAARATRTYGFSPIILGSAAERPRACQLEHLLKRFVPAARIWNLAGETTLRQLAALLDRVDLLLTNDSGPMHLAAAHRTSVIGLFTCTSAVRSGPPGDRHELVSTEVSCAASYRKRCPHRGLAHMACLEELSTERVWQAFVRLIDRRGVPPRDTNPHKVRGA